VKKQQYFHLGRPSTEEMKNVIEEFPFGGSTVN
jgi:hypothetical protein